MSKRKTYFPKADVMMYVCQLNNPATGEQWVNMPAVIKMLDARLGKTILDYALIVHNRDTVTDADIESRDKQRLDYMARMYYQALGSDMSIPITRACFSGKTAQLQIRISDPLAVTQLEGTGNFINTILYPFTVVTENVFVVNFIASIWRLPLIAPFFALALSALALGLIVKFMR